MTPPAALSLAVVLAAAAVAEAPVLGLSAAPLDTEGYCARLALATAQPARARASCLAREAAARARLAGRGAAPAIARYCRALAALAESYVVLEDCLDRQERARALGPIGDADAGARVRCEALAATVGGGATVLQYCLDRERSLRAQPGS